MPRRGAAASALSSNSRGSPMPTPEARHERSNRITVEAIRIARRDGRTAEERARIYEREIERLVGLEPASRTPTPAAPPQRPAGFCSGF
jgi:hypothetical protein